MRILVVGGSGLIGAHVADVLRARGHTVTTVARTAQPGVDHQLDTKTASVDTLRALPAGHDGVVQATRTEEQRPVPRPVLPLFRRDLVEPVVAGRGLTSLRRLSGLPGSGAGRPRTRRSSEGSRG